MKFGFSFIKHGIAYKTIVGKETSQFHFGIYPVGKIGDFCREASNAGFGIFYRVKDFGGYLIELKDKGIIPVSTVNGPEGRLAFFIDPEGNHINLWEASTD